MRACIRPVTIRRSYTFILRRQLSLTVNRVNMSGAPKIISVEELPASEAKWVTLKKVNWQDPEGKHRVWECAERKTRGSSGIDAVDILALIRSKTNAFPLSTIIIEQYRPSVDEFVVEMPAGLIEDGETAEQAAVRELEEETGFKSDVVLDSSGLQVADPGMTTANMKTVVVAVTLPDKMETPVAKLDPGEFITVRTVELAKLNQELKAYEKKEGYVVDSRLSHWAAGYELAERVRKGDFN